MPTVPIPFLEQLLSAPEDIALGPAEDGGYYAISARRTHADMFAHVEWSTARAREQTVTACRGRYLERTSSIVTTLLKIRSI